MSRKLVFVIPLVMGVIFASSALGQSPATRQQAPGQFILPFSQPSENRIKTQRQRTTQPQSRQIPLEDIQEMLESFFPEDKSQPRPSSNSRDYYRQRTAPALPRRTLPTADQFASLPVLHQGRLLQEALLGLEEELGGLSTGDAWAKHLYLRSLFRLLVAGGSEGPDEDARLRLSAIANQFDAVAAEPSYRRISSLRGFETLKIGLPEYAADPLDRDRRLLSVHTNQLRSSLKQIKNGDSWIEYLQLEELEMAAQASVLPRTIQGTLAETVNRMDEAEREPAYQPVSRVEGFDRMRQTLTRLLTHLQSTDTSDIQRVAQAIQRNLIALEDAGDEFRKAYDTLATVVWADSESEKQHEVLRLIKQRHDDELTQAQERLRLLVKAIKSQDNCGKTMKSLSLASRQPGLKAITMLQEYHDPDSATGFKVLKKTGSDSLATKTLTLADRKHSQDLIKRLQAYEQTECARRVKLLPAPGDTRDSSGESTDRDRVLEIIKRLYEQQDDETEYVLMQFDDIPEPEEVMLLQFEDVPEPEEVVLLQFEDVDEPAEVTVMQFSNVGDHEDNADESDR